MTSTATVYYFLTLLKLVLDTDEFGASHMLHLRDNLFAKAVSMALCCILLLSINQLFHLS